MYLLLSNSVTSLMLFEDSLFVYPLGNDCVKLRGTQFEQNQFWNANSIVKTIFFKVWILPFIFIKFKHFFSLDITNCEHLSLELPVLLFIIIFIVFEN